MKKVIKNSILEIQTSLGEIATIPSLYEERNFVQRVEAIDFIGFHLIEQIEYLQRETEQPGKLVQLKDRAEKLRSQLEEVDIRLFHELQAKIRTGRYTESAFKELICDYVDVYPDYKDHGEDPGYDNLDILINGLSHFQTMPQQTKELEPEMVFYQKTPARIVFDLVERSRFMKEDIFFDLGSGLGQVPILVNLLTGIRTKGVEFEPAFCDYARNCAATLHLSQVAFINADARIADYSEGTVFFMFTPFKGRILMEVLERLRKESLRRRIKLFTYGPCTTEVALQSWLEPVTPGEGDIYKLSSFNSL